MATRSYIGIKNENGKVDYIYCHWDGYPEHHGPILRGSYKTKSDVEELLELGDLSSLDTDPDGCEAYHRDRGESKKETRQKTADLNELLAQHPLGLDTHP